MRFKATIMDEEQMWRAVIRMGHEIIEHNRGAANLVLVGIESRGVPLAKELAQIIRNVEGREVPCGSLRISYRNEAEQRSDTPLLKRTELPFPITGATVVLVDDVLHTGRTVREALEALARTGRPKAIQLAVLVDRGGRELPIGADYVGKTVPTSRNELVSVSVKEIDGKNGVDILSID
ncbi:MAG: bifunctional pyr operon transcriptional regulator/uracil phosphoribosyltransferase PyrR [Clostridiales bacterium]|nr:bifunctional pyr operon transcriptional regulator/uracil phosphoribosyltransferase PyrR [Clostridiales bacterium]